MNNCKKYALYTLVICAQLFVIKTMEREKIERQLIALWQHHNPRDTGISRIEMSSGEYSYATFLQDSVIFGDDENRRIAEVPIQTFNTVVEEINTAPKKKEH